MTVDLDHSVTMKAAGVRGIDPIADPTTRTRTVYLTLERSAAGLSPRHHHLGHLHAAGVAARRPAGDGDARARTARSFVWVVDPAKSTVSQRDVTVASRATATVVVTTGITAGERVVIAGVHSLEPGQQVKAPQ